MQLAGEDAPSVPVAVELRGHSDARLQEVQATAQVTNASLTVRLGAQAYMVLARPLLNGRMFCAEQGSCYVLP